MASFKFLHSADIHLDSPLRGLERYDGAPVEQIRNATRTALENLVALAIAEDVRLVLLVGDLYDGAWTDYNTGLFFARQMSRLGEHGIPVVLVRGNHDAASQITRHLRWPGNVRELPTNHPVRLPFEDLDAVLHGQGFAQRRCDRNLAAAYGPPEPGSFNIGLLHTSATGSGEHEPYAPCRLEDLVGKGYDYWALGHVHARQTLCRTPWIGYPGNLQGRHIRETGPKGCLIAAVEDGRLAGEPEFHAVDAFRWETCQVDLTACRTVETAVDHVATQLRRAWERHGELGLAVRLTLIGASPAHVDLVRDPEGSANQIRLVATELSGGRLWVESVRTATRVPIDLAALAARDDAVGGLLRSLAQLRDTPGAAGPLLAAELGPLAARLPRECRQLDEELIPTDPEGLAAVLEEVQQLLIAHLVAEESAG